MDALRMSQIREALDADKIVQGQAFDIVKRWVSTQQEEPVEYQQLNEEDINTAGELVSAFQELLEKKLAEVSHRVRNNTGDPPASDSEIGLVEDVVNAYNRIISIVINPGNTQQTKEALRTTLMKSEATIKRLEVLLEHILDRLWGSANAAILKPGFGVFLKAYNVYDLISKQLTSQSFLIITAEDLQANLNAILTGRRQWGDIMRRYDIDEPDYNPIQNTGPPRGGPPPGPGPSGGPFGPDSGPSRRPRQPDGDEPPEDEEDEEGFEDPEELQEPPPPPPPIQDRFSPQPASSGRKYQVYPQELPQFGPLRQPVSSEQPLAPQRDINFDLLASKMPRPPIGTEPPTAPALRNPGPLEIPEGGLPHTFEDPQQLSAADLGLSPRTPTKVNGVSITDVGKIAVGFLSKIIQQQQEAARQAHTQEKQRRQSRGH
jgi:hypothetical protein